MYGQLRGRTISLCKRQVASQRRVAGLVGLVASSRLYVSLPRVSATKLFSITIGYRIWVKKARSYREV